MAKQISKATRGAKDSEGTRKRTGREPIFFVASSDFGKEFVVSGIVKRSAPAAIVTGAKIGLLANEHISLRDIAVKLDIDSCGALKWVRKTALHVVRSLGGAPRFGTPRAHGDDNIAEVVKLTTTTDPPDASTSWSIITMAALAGVPPSTAAVDLANLWAQTSQGCALYRLQ